MEDHSKAFDQAAEILPQEVRRCVLALPEQVKDRAEEIRLRLGRRPTVLLPDGELSVPDAEPVTRQTLQLLVERASRWSLHTVLDQIRRGYLTLEGGHRLGLCGTTVMEQGRIMALRDVTSADLRIARFLHGDAHRLAEALFADGALQNTLILAPPGAGKTTLLRDLIRAVSDGDAGRAGLRVAVADERGELAGGSGQPELGARTDVLSGCPKAVAIPMLLRAMSPQVIAVDEITAPEDIQAMEQTVGCGVALLATAHGSSAEDMLHRPLYRRLMGKKIFRRILTIRIWNGKRITGMIPADEIT